MCEIVLCSYPARNIRHPVVILWDVSFTPESGDFYQQRYQCMLNIRATIAKMPQEAYLAQNPDASFGQVALEKCQ